MKKRPSMQLAVYFQNSETTMAIKSILVIDDDLQISRLVRFILESAKYKVRTANNGEQALLLLAAEKPDLIFCDVAMPVMDGFMTVQAVRSNPAWHDVPIIMLTALGDVRDLDRAFSAGANGFLGKPFSPKEMLATVAQLSDA